MRAGEHTKCDADLRRDDDVAPFGHADQIQRIGDQPPPRGRICEHIQPTSTVMLFASDRVAASKQRAHTSNRRRVCNLKEHAAIDRLACNAPKRNEINSEQESKSEQTEAALSALTDLREFDVKFELVRQIQAATALRQPSA
jgi:hypothetical protein